MNMVLAIAAGGAVGSVLRHYAGRGMMAALGTEFPYGTMFVNVLGSFLMGVIVAGMAQRWDLPPEMRAFLTVGLLGGFTTFSTFSLDVMALYERGQVAIAIFYASASVIVSIAAIFAGMALMRSITT